MSQFLLSGARDILSDAIHECLKRRKRLTMSEWETILRQYEWVVLAAHNDNLSHDNKRTRIQSEKYRLAELLDKLILNIDPDN